MMRARSALLLACFVAACAPSGCEDYAGWQTYEDPSGLFTVDYQSPPWTICSGTEFEADCRECPRHLLGEAACGGASQFAILWIEPALLDPEFLLIPSYKLEISWLAGEVNPLDLAAAEEAVMVAAGLELTRSTEAVSFHDGALGAEVAYRGPVHILVNEDPVSRPDEREYRIVYTSGSGHVFRLQMDSAIDADLPEVGDMLGSFTLDVGGDG